MLPQGGFQIHGYLIEPRRNSIAGPGGQVKTVGRRAMAVLICLVERAGQVVTKDEILDAVWRDEHVTESSLFNVISELRGAFEETAGERPCDSELVANVRGVGYTLNAEVEPIEPPAPAMANRATEGASPAASAVLPGRSRRVGVTLAVAVPLTLIAALAIWRYGSQKAEVRAGLLACRDEARALYQEAKTLYDTMKYDRAINLLGQAMAADPSCAFPHELRSRIYNGRGDRELARRDIEEALRLSANLDETTRIFFLRRKAQIEGDVAGELGFLKRLNFLEPLKPEWHYHLGWFYKTHYRDCDKSQRRFQDAVKRDPKPAYHARLCEAFLVCGQVKEALAHLEEYSTLQPGVMAHDYRGWVFTLIGEYERAEHELEQARGLDPDHHHAVLTRGIHYAARGFYSRAIEELNDYRSRVELPNEEAVAHATLAEVHLARRDFDAAIDHAGKALEIHPNSHQALWARGQALLGRGELDAAEEVARALEELGASSGSLYRMEYLHHLRGRLAWAEGRHDEAVAEFREALALNPVDRAFLGDELAGILFASGDLRGAEKAYSAVLEFNPNYGRSRCGLGELYERQGFTDDAVDEYEHCLRAFGEDNSEEPLVARAKERLAVLR